jgi:hypothetical protein
VIPAVHDRGQRVGGLLRYLYGPGKKEEHTDPHLVAAWDGAGELADLEPTVTATGKRDFRHLIDLLEIPVRAGRNPPRLPVWHCSLRTHPTDRTLSDDEWRHIAAEVMARTGLAPHGDEHAVRWVALRHATDHVHLVATLVRQDRRTVWPRYDFKLSQAACRDIEARYGLYRVAPTGQGTRAWPKPGELNKAARQGWPVAAREKLRRRLRAAATVAVDEVDFFARLHADGIKVRARYSTRNPGEVTGYAVALPGHTTATGDLVFYRGSRLAADLSLPRLRTRWTADTSLAEARRGAARRQPVPAQVYAQAARTLRDVAGRLRDVADDPAAVAALAGAAADVLAAAATAWEGGRGGPLTGAAELLDRAAHEHQRRHPARRGSAAYGLRAMARLVGLMGELSGDQATAQAMQLVLELAALAETLAELRQARLRLHQAEAARSAVTLLRGYTPAVAANRTAASVHQPRGEAPRRQWIDLGRAAGRSR